MLDALYNFEQDLEKRGGIAFFHYGGHAVQVNGKNYLIPVDIDIPDERRVTTRALDSEEIMATLEASGSDSNIIILDSCRNNPLPGESRSGARGLAVTGKKPKNSIIVYSAESGTVAQDGVFTPALLKYIETPNTSFSDILLRIRKEVYTVSKGAQTPGSYNQLFENIYLAGTATGAAVDTGAVPVDPRDPQAAALPEDFVLVEGGTFQMGSYGGDDDEKPVHSVTLKDFAISKYEVTVRQFREFVNATGYKTTAETSGGAYVWTGSTWVQKSDASWKNPYMTQSNSDPVVCVSWYDVVEYCNWLSSKEGKTPAYRINGNNVTWNKSADGYRLPTEAEWEYAAKGGSKSRNYTYAGSGYIGNIAWYSGNSGKKTHPVGQKQANELGIYDMTGNVWEWCWDWYGDYSSGSVSYPAGASSGSYRVLRGGGWYGGAFFCRAANRISDDPGSNYEG